jgi:protein SCO1/2
MIFRRSLPGLILVALLGAACGAMVARMLAQKSPVLHSGTWLPQPRPLAAFTLADLAGRTFDNSALLKHPSLLFFGFSSCPAICPTTLATMAALMKSAPLPDLQLLFASVDPQRDQAATLRPYLASFDPRFIGLVGSTQAMAPLLHSLGASAERHALNDGSYSIDHSATLYLLDTRGRMAAVFSPPFEAASLRADLERIARAAVL